MVLEMGRSGQYEDRRLAGYLLAAGMQERLRLPIGQPQIEQQHIGLPVLQETKRLPITVACPNLASVVRENKLNQIPDGRIVLDDQHTWSGHHGSSSLREQPPRADPA